MQERYVSSLPVHIFHSGGLTSTKSVFQYKPLTRKDSNYLEVWHVGVSRSKRTTQGFRWMMRKARRSTRHRDVTMDNQHLLVTQSQSLRAARLLKHQSKPSLSRLLFSKLLDVFTSECGRVCAVSLGRSILLVSTLGTRQRQPVPRTRRHESRCQLQRTASETYQFSRHRMLWRRSLRRKSNSLKRRPSSRSPFLISFCIWTLM